MMLEQPQHKYRPVHPFTRDYAEWTPSRRLDAPPIWMSTDMRDGNQALIEPMDAARKLRFFEQLVAVGLKEIEVAFPSASDTDFNFVRQLIEEERIPDDVTIEVLTQSRPDLIERTFESLRGARRAIVHLYNPIAPQWRRIVFGMSRDEIKDLALAGTRQIRALADADPGTEWIYEYSPETFSRRAGLCAGGLRRGQRHLEPQPGAQDDHQSAIHRGMRQRQRLRRPDRMDAPPRGATASCSACIRTTTVARPSQPPSWR